MKTLIKVRRKHINEGMPSAESCPVALAIEDSGLGDPEVVGAGLIIVNGKKYKEPRSVTRFIAKFDEGKKVKPFNFFLVEKQ